MRFRGQRSVFTTRRHAAYPALTYAFSIGSIDNIQTLISSPKFST
jgi:hypothetical protein